MTDKAAIILFGDSLTAWSFEQTHGQGFGEVLEKHFATRGIAVENEGYPGYTSETTKPFFASIMSRIRTSYKVPPLLITIFLGANDAVFSPSVHVPLPQFLNNIRSFVDQILTEPKAAGTRVLLITTPPINVHKPEMHPTWWAERLDTGDEEFEQICREGIGFRTWENKLKYAQGILDVAAEYENAAKDAGEECRVAAVDFWRNVTNFALGAEGREGLPEGPVVVDSEARSPGSGLPGAEEFPDGVFWDRLHLDGDGYRVLTESIMGMLRGKWPDILAA